MNAGSLIGIDFLHPYGARVWDGSYPPHAALYAYGIKAYAGLVHLRPYGTVDKIKINSYSGVAA